jgi:hypothetical protein
MDEVFKIDMIKVLTSMDQRLKICECPGDRQNSILSEKQD